jgi:hypothetical protein
MSIRISPDEHQPSASVEIPLSKPLPDYDLEQLEQPTPRDVDGVLVSQGFRDLIDDSRGVLMDLLANPPHLPNSVEGSKLDFTSSSGRHLELAQLTGAICPGDDNVYRPGLWIVLRDPSEKPTLPLCHLAQQRVFAIIEEFVSRMGL